MFRPLLGYNKALPKVAIGAISPADSSASSGDAAIFKKYLDSRLRQDDQINVVNVSQADYSITGVIWRHPGGRFKASFFLKHKNTPEQICSSDIAKADKIIDGLIENLTLKLDVLVTATKTKLFCYDEESNQPLSKVVVYVNSVKMGQTDKTIGLTVDIMSNDKVRFERLGYEPSPTYTIEQESIGERLPFSLKPIKILVSIDSRPGGVVQIEDDDNNIIVKDEKTPLARELKQDVSYRMTIETNNPDYITYSKVHHFNKRQPSLIINLPEDVLRKISQLVESGHIQDAISVGTQIQSSHPQYDDVQEELKVIRKQMQ